jgi:hypothetical protein
MLHPHPRTPLGEHETTLSASAASSDAKHGPLPSSKVAASCSANLIYLAFIAALPINSLIRWPVRGVIDANVWFGFDYCRARDRSRRQFGGAYRPSSGIDTAARPTQNGRFVGLGSSKDRKLGTPAAGMPWSALGAVTVCAR